jgi:hypothetical protein
MGPLLLGFQDPKPLIVVLQPKPAQTTSIADVIVGALGIAGALTLAAIVLGCLVAVGLVIRHRMHPPDADHLPPVSPLIPQSPPSPPTPTR